MRYRLDAHYPMSLWDTGLDEKITEAVGVESESSGGGITGRDLNFYFDSAEDRDEAAGRISAAGLLRVSVVRREECDN